MNDASCWMIYGANGYTGRLIAEEAVARGHRPILAGRNRAAVEALADKLNCRSQIFDLDAPAQLSAQLAGLTAVVHCAGPFSATARPMMDACLAAACSYLDITGEIDVIEAGHQRHERAAAAGIALMPAVGFDVVPTDCLAATLAAELPSATHLQLAFDGDGGVSPGTAKTMIETLPSGGRARIDGRLTRVPAVWKTREIPFRRGRRFAVTIPWGDVASAYYSTGIPNIEVYLATPPKAAGRLRLLRPLLPLAGLAFVQSWLKRRIERNLPGPSIEERESSRSSIWGCVTDAEGNSVEATLETPGGYPLTVLTTLAVLEKILNGRKPQGFATPSQAYGKDLILEIPDTNLRIESRIPVRSS